MMKTPSRQEKAPVTQSCGSCRYYKEFELDDEPQTEEDDEHEEDDPETVTGVCRRFPPTLFASIVSTSAWPEVSSKTGWCGEFTPRE